MTDKNEAPPSTALARVEPSAPPVWSPQSFREIQELATIAFKSQVFKLQSPEDATMRILTSQSLGLHPVVGLRKMHSVEGQLGISADLVRALVIDYLQRQDATAYFEFVESTQELCTMEMKRPNRPAVRYTYTIEDAKAAGLVDRPEWGKLKPEELEEKKKKSNWYRYRKNMLRARCTTDMASMYCPQATMGMPSVEELHDERDPNTITVNVDPQTGDFSAPSAQPNYAPKLAELRELIAKAATKEDFQAARKAIQLAGKPVSEGGGGVPEFYLLPVTDEYSAARDAAQAKAKGGAT